MKDFLYQIDNVIKHLRQNNECGWIEVKEKQIEEDKLGETISAISNYCLLHEKEFGYIIIGLKDKTWEIIGTDKKFCNFYKGNQTIELYLKPQLSPEVEFKLIDDFEYENKLLSVVIISSATHTPISFKKESYIRIGSNNKKLRDFPETAKVLWTKASGFNYEESIIVDNLSFDSILELLDYESFYQLQQIPIPNKMSIIENDFINKEYILKDNDYNFKITALGALLFGRSFEKLKIEYNKIRVVVYNGKTKSKISEQKFSDRGYINGFQNLIKFVNSKLSKEIIFDNGLRKEKYDYEPNVLRELIANAIIHQDLSVKGNKVKIEIYSDRIEISNPGSPIINIWNFYNQNKTRNVKLADNMMNFKICEQLGSGIDRIVEICETDDRFTPIFHNENDVTTVVLFKEKSFENMSDEEKINILYYHCCFKSNISEYMNNASLRIRYKMESNNANSNKVTRIINKAIERELIKSAPNKTYIPFWKNIY